MKDFRVNGVTKYKTSKGLFWRGFITWREGESDEWHKLSRVLTDEDGERIPARAGKDDNRGKGNAEKALQRWCAELVEAESIESVEPLPNEPASVPLSEYVSRHLARIVTTGNGDGGIELSTADSYEYMARHITRYFHPDTSITDLTPDSVQAWVDYLKDNGVGVSSRIKAFNILSRVCEHAVKMGHIRFNPCAPIEKPRAKKADPNPLDTKELHRLNALLNDRGHDRFADMCRFALLTGMREGEICGLRWKDVDGWDDGQFTASPRYAIHVNNVIARSTHIGNYNKPYPKNRRARTIPNNEDMAEVLAARRLEMREECLAVGVPFTGELYVFGDVVGPDQPGTGFFSPAYLGKLFRMFVETFGLKGIKGRRPVFHDLRHSFATHSIMAGVDVKVVSEILGHSSSGFTLDVYADCLPEGKRAAMDSLTGVMSASSSHRVIAFRPTGTDNV